MRLPCALLLIMRSLRPARGLLWQERGREMRCRSCRRGPARSIGPAARRRRLIFVRSVKKTSATADATASMPQSITSVSGIADPYVVAVEIQRLRLSLDAEVEVL